MNTLQIELGPAVASRTYGAIISFFEKRFDESGTEWREKTLEVLRDVVLDIASRYPWTWLYGSDSIVTTSGLAVYALNGEVAWIESGVMIVAGERKVRRRPMAFIRECQAGSDSPGPPRYFAVTERQEVILWPTPDAAYTLVYDYRRQFEADILETDTPPMPVSDTFVLKHGAEEQLRRDENEFDAAGRLAANRYEAGISRLMFNEECGKNHQAIPEELPPSADDELNVYGY